MVLGSARRKTEPAVRRELNRMFPVFVVRSTSPDQPLSFSDVEEDVELVDGRTPVACGLPSGRIRPGGERMTLRVEIIGMASVPLLEFGTLG